MCRHSSVIQLSAHCLHYGFWTPKKAKQKVVGHASTFSHGLKVSLGGKVMNSGIPLQGDTQPLLGWADKLFQYPTLATVGSPSSCTVPLASLWEPSKASWFTQSLSALTTLSQETHVQILALGLLHCMPRASLSSVGTLRKQTRRWRDMYFVS